MAIKIEYTLVSDINEDDMTQEQKERFDEIREWVEHAIKDEIQSDIDSDWRSFEPGYDPEEDDC